jgi:hypothetical protein
MDTAPRAGDSEFLSSEWTPLGTHRWRFQRPILSLELNGDFRLQDFDEYVATYRKLWGSEHNFGLLVDASQMKGAHPDVRRRIIKELPKDGPSIPIALLHASLPMRTVLILVSNAQRLLFGDEPTFAFFSSEPAAQGWLRLRISDRERTLQALAQRR